MATLYQSKAKNYQVRDGDDYSDDFKLWCWKLNDITPAQFAQGVKMMEYQEAEGRKTGDETWPPSYAGFLGMATMATGSRSTFVALPPCTLSKTERLAMLKSLREETDL